MSRDNQGSGQLSYGELIPKLSPDDTDGKPVLLTIRRARVQNMAPEGKREENKIVLEFAERFDGEDENAQRREYIVNATSYKTLCDKMGTVDHMKWIGKPVVMAPTNTEYGGRTYEKMHVASPERWEKVVAATKKPAPARKTAGKTADA